MHVLFRHSCSPQLGQPPIEVAAKERVTRRSFRASGVLACTPKGNATAPNSVKQPIEEGSPLRPVELRAYAPKRSRYLFHRSRSFLPSDSRTKTSKAAALPLPVRALTAAEGEETSWPSFSMIVPSGETVTV